MPDKLNEIELQKLLRNYLSEPSLHFVTESGKRVQILSMGEHNVHEGPDFKDAAILIEGNIAVGDIEYHFRESEWNAHGHSGDPLYSNVILHIVSQKAEKSISGLETLLIELDKFENAKKPRPQQLLPDAMEDLQHFALIRLLRKASEAKKVIEEKGLESALLFELNKFLDRYSTRRRRPVYTPAQLDELPNAVKNSHIWTFLGEVRQRKNIDIVTALQAIIKHAISGEGPHLRRELVLNCILPIAICVAAKQARLDIFVWFWSAKSLHDYGVLTRKFPDFSQEYLWQQQGLLEYQRMYGNKKNIVAEALRNYGFADILDFYKFGSTDFDFFEENTSDIEELDN